MDSKEKLVNYKVSYHLKIYNFHLESFSIQGFFKIQIVTSEIKT
jgi:hypothetical protein